MTAPLYERYRPTTLDDVLGQPKACRVLQRFADNAGGRASVSGSRRAHSLDRPADTGPRLPDDRIG